MRVLTIFGKEVRSFSPQKDASKLSLTCQAVTVLYNDTHSDERDDEPSIQKQYS